MGNLSHTVGGTDNLVSFKSSARVPIDSLKVHFSPIQEGEGDPSPENVRPIRGWNDVEIYRDGDKKTRQVTWNQWCKPLNDENWRAYNTANNDIQFENGIATSIWLQNKSGYNASIRLKTGIPQRNKEVWYVSYMVKPSISGLTWGVEYNGGLQHICAELVGTDTWTRCSDCDLYHRGTNNYVYISYCRSFSVDLTGLVTQTKAPLLINLTQMFGYGNEPSKEEFETQCLLNGIDLTEAFPYDEGHVMEWKTSTANIKYHIPISVPEKNLFNIDAPYAEPSNTDYGDLTTLRTFQPYTYCIGLKYANIYYPTAVSNFSCSNGTISFTTTVDKYFGVCYAIPLSYGTYTITYTANNATADISLYDKDGAFIENHNDQSTFTVSKNSVMAIIVFRAQTIDIPSTVSDVQIVEGVKTIEYKSFDPDNAVYGGYVDLVKGEVVAEYGHYTFSGSEKDSITYYDTSSTLDNVERHRFRTKILDRLPIDYSSNLAYANIAKPNSTKSGDFLFYIGTPTNQILLYIKSSMCEPTVESFNAWLSEHPLQLVYKLKDPIHYPLTSTQLKTFLNNNAFWSNTNDVTEVSYAIHDAAPIRAARKRIMAASPHLETTSGGLVNFNTDVAAPLKECKVYFEPVQEGEGNPSPENIRPIKGWTSIDLYKSGKNLIHLPVMTRTIKGITWTVNEDGSIQVDGTATDNTQMSYWQNNSQHVDFYLKAGTYALSRNGTPPVASIYLVARDGSTTKDIGQVARTMDSAIFTLNQDTLVGFQAAVTPDQGEIHTIIHPQLESLSFTNYEAPNNSMIPITFSSEAGTIYGGYVDLVKGKLIQEWIQVKINSLSWTYMNSGECFRSQVPMERVGYKEMSPVRSSIYETLEVGSTISSWADRKDYSISEHLGNSGDTLIQAIHIKDSRYTTVSDFLNDVGNENIVYKLLTPIEYSITPQTLKTLRGTNNIWSNSNGPISIKYWKH